MGSLRYQYQTFLSTLECLYNIILTAAICAISILIISGILINHDFRYGYTTSFETPRNTATHHNYGCNQSTRDDMRSGILV